MTARSSFAMIACFASFCCVAGLAGGCGGNQSRAKEADHASETERDRYQIPSGGVAELLDFIKDLQALRGTIPHDEYETKAFSAMKVAAERIQEIANADDRKLAGFDEATAISLYFRVTESGDNPKITGRAPLMQRERAKLVADIKTYFATSDNPSIYAFVAAEHLASYLEDAGCTKLEKEVCHDIGSSLVKSKNRKVARLGAKMEGAVRRLGLQGNPLQVSGTVSDGTKFDWTKYRAKVVLVDFWATWCKPCLEELPNVKKNFALYHNRGFEVISVNVDNDHAALEKFLAAERPPWVMLYDGAWDDNPVTTYYGISRIPTAILVDREGNVVTTDALGTELGKQLERLIDTVRHDK
jgi:thiol-disulfide isomerase/thioredoxin